MKYKHFSAWPLKNKTDVLTITMFLKVLSRIYTSAAQIIREDAEYQTLKMTFSSLDGYSASKIPKRQQKRENGYYYYSKIQVGATREKRMVSPS